MALLELHIENFALIEKISLNLEKGFTVFSGETGAGKSAMMEALKLLTGGRVNSQILRLGAEKARVEAVFFLHPSHPTFSLLSEKGVEYSEEEPLLLRREVSLKGPNRCWINNSNVTLALLQEVGESLVEIVGQHSTQMLFQKDYHRECVDLFGGEQKLLEKVEESWQSVERLKRQLVNWKEQQRREEEERERLQDAYQELEEAAIEEDEEEKLFDEYTRLSQAEELAQYIHDAEETFNGEGNSSVLQLTHGVKTLEQAAAIDKQLKPLVETLLGVIEEVREVGFSLSNYKSDLEIEPQRLEAINQRLSQLHRLKKKYGESYADLRNYQQSLEETLSSFENLEEDIALAEKQLKEEEENFSQLSHELSEKRTVWAELLQNEVTTLLQKLNMPDVLFQCILKPVEAGPSGKENVEFYFKPNKGEKLIPIKECASGGELSRMLLVLKTLLANKEGVGTLIFDEIDTGIGGETATYIGEMLQKLSQQRQVLCITHLPQIALKGSQHFLIAKKEKEGRTVTSLEELKNASRKKELARMLGGTLFSEATHELADKLCSS